MQQSQGWTGGGHRASSRRSGLRLTKTYKKTNAALNNFNQNVHLTSWMDAQSEQRIKTRQTERHPGELQGVLRRAQATNAGLEANQAARSCATCFQPNFLGSLSAGLATCLKNFSKNSLPAPTIESLWVKAMPLVLKLGEILLLPPPPCQVPEARAQQRGGNQVGDVQGDQRNDV